MQDTYPGVEDGSDKMTGDEERNLDELSPVREKKDISNHRTSSGRRLSQAQLQARHTAHKNLGNTQM